jgi:hypothetical protein
MMTPSSVVHNEPAPNASVKYAGNDASPMDGGAMSARTAWSCGLSAKLTRTAS